MALDLKEATRVEVRRTSTGNNYSIYIFACSACGAEISTQHGQAHKHSGKCLSCAHKKGGRYYAAYQTMVRQSIRGGRNTSIIAYEEYEAIREGGLCHYCSSSVPNKVARGTLGYRGYFIDRKDNAKGYVTGNCVLCCWKCNQAKGDRYSYTEFMQIASLLKDLRRPKYTDRRAEFLKLNGWNSDE